MGDSRAQLLDVVRQVRRRWRIKLALKGAVGFLLAGLVAILAIAYALETLKFTPTAIFWFRIVTGLVLVAAGAWFFARPLSRKVSDEQVALYLEDASQPGFGSQTGDTIGLKVGESSSGKAFFYIPGCARFDDDLAARLDGAALVFFDGTLYTDDEMLRQGLMAKTGGRMGHMNMSGPDGSMAAFAQVKVGRRVFVHINNSNPVLDENSEARKAVESAGWEVGYDGMELRL